MPKPRKAMENNMFKFEKMNQNVEGIGTIYFGIKIGENGSRQLIIESQRDFNAASLRSHNYQAKTEEGKHDFFYIASIIPDICCCERDLNDGESYMKCHVCSRELSKITGENSHGTDAHCFEYNEGILSLRY